MAAAEGRVIHFEGGRSYKLRSTGGYLKKKKKSNRWKKTGKQTLPLESPKGDSRADTLNLIQKT